MADGGLLLAAEITDRRRQCGLDEYILIRMAAEGFAAVSSVWRHFNEEKFFLFGGWLANIIDGTGSDSLNGQTSRRRRRLFRDVRPVNDGDVTAHYFV